MLRQRVITALLLVAIFLPALFHADPLYLGVLSLVMITLAAWEWARLVGCRPMTSVMVGAACLAMCVLSEWLGWVQVKQPGLWALMVLVWVLGSVGMLRLGVSRWAAIPTSARVVFGLVLLWATWMAFCAAKARGTNFILSVLVLVWVADVSAYFAGRTFGRRKLAPTISPGKSWEGVMGAVVGVALLSQFWIWIDAQNPEFSLSVYTLLAQQGQGVLWVGLLFLTAMSVVGDLVESLIKRSAGVKDSSALLPGHGGVLDRVDALLPTLPLAMWLVTQVRA